MKKYKYILWDIDDTLTDFSASEAYSVKKLFRDFGLGECTNEILSRYSKINKKYVQKLEAGEMTRPEILVGRFAEFFENEGLDPSISEEFNRAYIQTLGEYVLLQDGALEIISATSKLYTTIGVTNGTKTAQIAKLRKSGLDKLFHMLFISEDMGCEKPSKEFFDIVFERAGIRDKKEVIIIGDSISSDMAGGFGCGIDTCWYNPNHRENPMNIPVTYEVHKLREVRNII